MYLQGKGEIMDSKKTNIKSKRKKEKYNFLFFEANNPEELAKIMTDKIPEKDFQNIMGLVNSVKKQGIDNTIDKTMNRSDEAFKDHEIHKHIIITKTKDATRILPILTNSNVKLEVSLDVQTYECENQSEDDSIDFNISSNIKEIDGIFPQIVIPHKYDGNDNEESISKIIDFFLSSYSEYIQVEELECHGIEMSGKCINIIQKK